MSRGKKFTIFSDQLQEKLTKFANQRKEKIARFTSQLQVKKKKMWNSSFGYAFKNFLELIVAFET